MNFLIRLFRVQPHELRKTVLLFLYLFLVVAAYVTAKSARDGMFLTQSTPLKLPYLYIAIASFMVPAISLYSRVIRRFAIQNATAMLHAFIAATLLFFWHLFGLRHSEFWLASFYVWVSIFGAISTSQFWLIAGQLNDARSAKRLFGVIGSGGILGGVAGGFAAKWLAQGWGTEQLLPLVAFLYLVCGGVVKTLPAPAADLSVKSKGKEDDGFKLLKGSRYLVWIAVILFITELASTFIDFQFKVISRNAFPEKNELTSFLGSFYGFLNIANFLFQIFFTAAIIQWSGVKGSILFLPLAIASGSLALFYLPVLWTAMWLKVGDDGLRHSLHRSVLELLYQPVPGAIRDRAKVFLDSFAVQSATALGGVLLLIYTSIFGSQQSPLGLIVFFLSIVWVAVCLITNREYVNAFREGLKKRSIDPEMVTLRIADVATLETLMQALNSFDERVVLYAVDLLQRGGKQHLVSPWLLHHPSAKVRLKIVDLISQRSDRSALSLLKGAIQDENVEVQAEALQTICLLEPESHEEMVFSLSHEKDPKLRRAAILCAALGSDEQQQKAHRWLEEMIRTTGPEGPVMQMEAAKALAKLPPLFHNLFPLLFNNPDRNVVRQAIRSAAATGNPDLIRVLVEKLGDRKLKAEAREALLKYKPEIVAVLETFLMDETIPIWARRHIPRTISAFGVQAAADTLFNHFDHPDPFIRYKILKALNQLRVLQTELMFDRTKVELRIIQEAKEFFNNLALKAAIFSGDRLDVRKDFLARSLDRRLDRSVERVFRFLALIYPHRDVFNAFESVKSKDPAFRSAAIEYLDNALERSIRRLVVLVIDNLPDQEKLNRIQSMVPIRRRSGDEALLELLNGADSWLSACAVYWIYQNERQDLYSYLQPSLHPADGLVRETVQWVSARIYSSAGQEHHNA